jgi:hypothetical protein
MNPCIVDQPSCNSCHYASQNLLGVTPPLTECVACEPSQLIDVRNVPNRLKAVWGKPTLGGSKVKSPQWCRVLTLYLHRNVLEVLI